MIRTVGIILVSLFSIASSINAQNYGQQQKDQNFLSSDNGRYVFGQISEMRRDQYLLDTKTGRLWVLVVDENQRNKLQPVPFIQIIGCEAYCPEKDSDAESFRDYATKKYLEDMIRQNDSSGQSASDSSSNAGQK